MSKNSSVPTKYDKTSLTYTPFDFPIVDTNKVIDRYNEKIESNLENDDYAEALGNWGICMSQYLYRHNVSYSLKAQLSRTELDTVCGIELKNLKAAVLDHNILDFQHWLPKE